MPLLSEKIPNQPLTGPEVKQLAVHLLEKALASEWCFNAGSSHPRVGIEIIAKFHFASPSMPKVEARVRAQAPLEAAPLRELGDADSGVIALTIEKTVENPNLERVHAGIPIQVTSKIGAQPGEMFPRIETHAVIYDKADYQEPDPPKQADISAETAKEWGVQVAEAPAEEAAPEVVEQEPVFTPPERRPIVETPGPKPWRKKPKPVKIAHIEAEMDAISTEAE